VFLQLGDTHPESLVAWVGSRRSEHIAGSQYMVPSGRLIGGWVAGWRGCFLLLEPASGVVGGDGPADVVALDGVAAEEIQVLKGERVLDSFGDHPQA
jgi:hypothetical protein